MESEAKAMRKIKWGVMGTAFICERSTFPGMLQAENWKKQNGSKKPMAFKKLMEAMRNYLQIQK